MRTLFSQDSLPESQYGKKYESLPVELLRTVKQSMAERNTL